MHAIDVAIVGAYVAYSVFWGLRSARAAGRGLEDYFLAGRTLRGWEAGLSMAATQFAADTPLVVTGLVATAGIFSLWRLWIYALAFLLMALVLGGPWRRAAVVTDAELTEVRYGGRPAAVLRVVKAVYFGVLFNCVVLAWVFLATTRITEPFLQWHALPALEGFHGFVTSVVRAAGFPLTASGTPCDATGACVVGACVRQRCIGPEQWAASADNVLSIGAILTVTTLYSTTGGLRSVVKTDLVQLAIALGSSVVYAAYILGAVGGFHGLVDGLAALFPVDGSGPGGMTAGALTAFTPAEASGASLAVVAVLAVQWLAQANADGSGYLAQRTMACRSDHDARVAGVVFTVTQVLVRSLLWLPIALGLLVLLPPDPALSGSALAAVREATYVQGIASQLPPGLLGLTLTGLLGALASTLDTHLNWGASYIANDIYARVWCRALRRREPSPRGLVWVARSANVVLLCIALAVMPLLDSIQAAWQASLLLGAGIGVPLLLRWLWWRMNAAGELAALGASAVLAPLLFVHVDDEPTRFLIMAAGATLVSLCVVLLTPAERTAQLREFYQRARPPGFWGPVAGADAAADRRRLAAGMVATFGTAFSIFALLTGLGSWIAGSPPPALVPSSVAWIALNLALGLGTCPLWVRAARASALRT